MRKFAIPERLDKPHPSRSIYVQRSARFFNPNMEETTHDKSHRLAFIGYGDDMGVTKVTLNLPSDLVERIKETAKQQHVSVTDVFRRGLERDLFLTKEEESGSKIILERANGKLAELIRRG